MKFKLLEKAYINDQLLDAGTLIGSGTRIPYEGAPGPHLEPLDTEAEGATQRWRLENPDATLNVFSKLPMHEGKHPEPLTAADLSKAMKEAMSEMGAQIAQAIASLVQQPQHQGAGKR